MAVMNAIKGGANLTHPRLSAGWIIGAVISIFLLIGIVLFGLFVWGKVQTNVPGVSSVTAPVRTYLS